MNAIDYLLGRLLEIALQNPARLLPWLGLAFGVTLVIAWLTDFLSGQAQPKAAVIDRRKERRQP